MTMARWSLAMGCVLASAAVAGGPHEHTRVIVTCPTPRVTIGYPVAGGWSYRHYDGYGRSPDRGYHSSGYHAGPYGWGHSGFGWYGSGSHGYDAYRHGSHGRHRSGVTIHFGGSYGGGVDLSYGRTVYGRGYDGAYGTGDACGSYPAVIVRKPRGYGSNVRGYGSGGRSSGDVSYGSLDQGWDLLVRGEAGRALRVFGALAEASPDKVLPKVGFALASVLGGDDRQAVWAMRRAFARDADALYSFPQDARLAAVVRRVEDRYLRRVERNYADVDAHFMIGALAFLRHDMERALVGVAHAEDHRDRSQSVRELRRVVERSHADYGGRASAGDDDR